MKKRTFAIFLAASLGASILGGCSKGNEAGSPAVSAAPSATAQDQTDAKQEQTAASAKSSASGTSQPGAGTSADSPKLPDLTGHTLMIYCGAGMAAPFQEIADAFKDATGCQVNATYANAGQIQSQITTTEEGDMFVAGSGDELKPVESYVEDKKDLVKHIPVLAVQSGNPKNITGLSDLTGDGVSLIMGDVDSTPIGKIAKKAMTDARTGFLQAVHIERIHGKSFIKRIVHTDENNDTRGQLFVTFPLPQSQRIQRSLVVPHSPSEIFSFGCLHLDIVERALVVLDVNVESYAFAVAADVDAFFRFRKHDFSDFDVQDLLDEALAETLLAHDFLKDEVIRDGQVFPDFVGLASRHFLHGQHSFLIQLYAEGSSAGKEIHCIHDCCHSKLNAQTSTLWTLCARPYSKSSQSCCAFGLRSWGFT